ncbi:MAG: hypothetical protein ACREF3_08530, partial [Acetobacteraceae bacterium]
MAGVKLAHGGVFLCWRIESIRMGPTRVVRSRLLPRARNSTGVCRYKPLAPQHQNPFLNAPFAFDQIQIRRGRDPRRGGESRRFTYARFPRFSAPDTRHSPFRVFRSASLRFAVVYAILLTASAAALALFLWWATAGLLDRQTDSAINADAQSLSQRWVEGGLPALILTIQDRLADDISDDAIYLLADPMMRPVAGNLGRWPSEARETGVWYEMPVRRAGITSLARLQRYNLPNGFHLLIGRDVQVRAELRTLLTDALLWAAVIVCAMATAGALVVRSLFRRTLANV